MKPPTGFLNVDLELGAPSRARLAPLIDALAEAGTMIELHRGRIGRLYRVHYESAACGGEAGDVIHALASAIEALRPAARRAWSAAVMRDFNVGVEIPRGSRAVELAIDAGAVRRVSALGGRIAITAYRGE